MTINYQVRGDDEMVRTLRDQPDAVQRMITDKFRDLALRMSDRVKQKLSGELLRVKTGRLRGSMVTRVYESANKVTLSMASRGDVPYAEIYEKGGRIGAHIIRARSREVLAFLGQRKQQFARQVRHPGVNVQARAYMQSTFEEMRPDLRGAVDAAIRESQG